jgi:hypothetical protein
MRSSLISNPYFVGVLIGVGLVFGVFASLRWAPSIWDDKNQWWMQLGFCATGLFAMVVGQYWRFHRHLRFWAGIAILVMVHVIVVLLLIEYVRRLALSNYVVILFVDAFVVVAFLESFVHKLRRKAD